jgi:hypothetical protein
MDISHWNDSKQWKKEKEREREEERYKIMEETLESYGIEKTVIKKMKTSLETPIRYNGTMDLSNQIVSYRFPKKDENTLAGNQLLHIKDAIQFLQIILVKIYKPGSFLWLQTLSRLQQWETLTADLVVELVNLVKGAKKRKPTLIFIYFYYV